MMASKISEIDDPASDPVHNTFQELWKLKDSVKIKIGTENFRHGAEFEQMQETKVNAIFVRSIASYIASYVFDCGDLNADGIVVTVYTCTEHFLFTNLLGMTRSSLRFCLIDNSGNVHNCSVHSYL